MCLPVATWISDQRVVFGVYGVEAFLPSIVQPLPAVSHRMSNDRLLVS